MFDGINIHGRALLYEWNYKFHLHLDGMVRRWRQRKATRNN